MGKSQYIPRSSSIVTLVDKRVRSIGRDDFPSRRISPGPPLIHLSKIWMSASHCCVLVDCREQVLDTTVD